MLSILLALAAAVSWGVSDFMGGLFARRLAVGQVLLISQAVGFLMLLVVASLRGAPALDGRSIAFAMAASATGMVGIAALYRGMAVGVVSIVAPISATGAALPVVFGLLRGERATPLQVVGIALALIGIVLASRSSAESSDSAPSTRPILAHGVGLAIVAALGFGGFFILVHEASAQDVLWAGVVQRLTGFCIWTVLAIARRTSVAIGWRSLPGVVTVGILDTAANVLFAFASTFGLVSLASVLASLFPVVTVILARFVLHERLSGSQATGVACALAGVALIAIS